MAFDKVVVISLGSVIAKGNLSIGCERNHRRGKTNAPKVLEVKGGKIFLIALGVIHVMGWEDASVN